MESSQDHQGWRGLSSSAEGRLLLGLLCCVPGTVGPELQGPSGNVTHAPQGSQGREMGCDGQWMMAGWGPGSSSCRW